jgi:hypothetical protein
MFFKTRKFLLFILCACFVGTGCYAKNNTVDAMLRHSKRLTLMKNGDKSGEIFDDVEYLKNLLDKLNWENSTDPQRKDLYMKLHEVVNEIDAYEQNTIQQLRDVAADAKKREQSTANKLLGGIAMGTMGLETMELASATAEKQAIEDAETAMRAYLATFTCQYTDGKTVAGGVTKVELPGGNELLPLVTEYKLLATDLAERKNMLGIPAGIESELILDKSEMGLYDDESVGITDGVYTSVSRALLDEHSSDAAELSAEKEELQNRIKTSAITVASTAVASIATNLAINGGKNNPVAQRADATRAQAYKILEEIIQNCNAAIAAASQEQSQNIHLLTDFDDLQELQGHPICK